jgi:hypothetical protein
MRDGFLHQVLGAAVAAVLSLTATIGAPAPSRPHPSRSAQPSPRSNPAPDPRPPSVPGHGSAGRDISWPNCPPGLGIPSRRTLGKPLPLPGVARFVVIGLTNGPGFHPNPCLADQVAYARSLRLSAAPYAVVTYPTGDELRQYGAAGPRTPTDRRSQLWNTGWAQATANVARMRLAGLVAPLVWVDVEPVRPPTPWSGDLRANRAVLEGALAAYRRAGLRVGVYSTAYLWRSIVGDARYGLPEWRPTGPKTKQAALDLCTRGGIQGGDAVLVQWVSGDVDHDLLCPGRPADDVLRELFVQL